MMSIAYWNFGVNLFSPNPGMGFCKAMMFFSKKRQKGHQTLQTFELMGFLLFLHITKSFNVVFSLGPFVVSGMYQRIFVRDWLLWRFSLGAISRQR